MTPPFLVVALAMARISDFLEAVGGRIVVWSKRANVVKHLDAWHQRLRTARAYKSRHRKGFTPPPYINWADAHRGRQQHWIATQPPVETPERQAALIRCAKTPTQEMTVPDFDSDVRQRYDRAIGSPHYLRLQPAQLEAEIEKIVLTRTESYPLRGAAPTYGEIGDKEYEYAEAMSS